MTSVNVDISQLSPQAAFELGALLSRNGVPFALDGARAPVASVAPSAVQSTEPAPRRGRPRSKVASGDKPARKPRAPRVSKADASDDSVSGSPSTDLESRKEAVVKVVGAGATQKADIVKATGFPAATVAALLSILRREDKIFMAGEKRYSFYATSKERAEEIAQLAELERNQSKEG